MTQVKRIYVEKKPEYAVAAQDLLNDIHSYLDIQSVYSQTMIENGILVFAIYNLMGSHTEKEAQAYLDATDKALALVRKAVDADSLDGILRGGKVDPVFKRNIK